MNRGLQNSILYILPSLIWGSTWIVIKLQLGVVSPILSVVYRFILAGLIIILTCIPLKLNLKFDLKSHLIFLLQGITLFGVNYWIVYIAEQYLTSGLIAVIFSLVVFFNMVFSAIILKTKITLQIVIGGILAIIGVSMIFKDELKIIFSSGDVLNSILLCLISVLLASLGNMIAGYGQKKGLPVVQSNGFGMIYGSFALFIIALIKGVPIVLDTRLTYIFSLGYLTLFGSIVAFTSYLKLLGRIGADKSAYVVVIIPVVAMIFSTIFESYVWQKSALVGLPLLALGNIIALNRLKTEKIKKRWK